MRAVSPRRLLLYVLLGALIGGILGGWVAMALGLVTLPVVLVGVQGLRRQLSH